MIRAYEHKDFNILKEMLLAENIPEDKQGFDKYVTWLLESKDQIEGFFTYNFKEGITEPSVVHFCVSKDSRSARKARELTKALKKTLRDLGHKNMIVHVVKEKSYLKTVIEYYFKAKPYATVDGIKFYFVEV